jgi:predicted MFS family arabinose efflux permease
MFAPTRLFFSLRPHAAVGLLAGSAFVAAMFAATPFLLPEIADRYGVALGTAGLSSAVQVGGFGAAAFVAGRRLSPDRSLMIGAGLVLVATGIGSALSTEFGLLLGLRLLAGAASGVVVWLAWVDTMGDRSIMRDVAATGPLTVLLLAPFLGWLAGHGGDQAVYWALAAGAVPIAFLPVRFAASPQAGRRTMSPSRSNVVLLVALGLLTMFGSSLFVYSAAVGRELVGLGDVAVAIGFSVNAGAGLVGARLGRRPRSAWPWLSVIAVSVVVMVFVPEPPGFFLAMAAWGFAFWMAVPTVLGGIAAWSLVPEERVGDAQSIMAVGRAAGPAAGGLVLGASSTFGPLAVFAAVGLVAAAAVVAAVERYRRDRRPAHADFPSFAAGPPD